MEPTIYKPGAYNTPGIYKGAGGIYNGRGVYNDISGGGKDNIIGGYEYSVIEIGYQKWLGENLKWKWDNLDINNGTSTTIPKGYYTNEASLEKYGILYNWPAVEYLEQNKLTMIPGWHLPTKEEINSLYSFLDINLAGKKLKSTYDWYSGGNGTDDYNFTALPSGYESSGSIIQNGRFFYAATTYKSGTYYEAMTFNYSDNKGSFGNMQLAIASSIRLIHD